MRKIIILICLIILVFPYDVHAISGKSAILIDGNSGRVLFEKNAHEKLPMASTTKIMTGYLACKSNKLTNSVTVSPFASGTEGSSLWLKPGEKHTLENLTYGLMLKSGNDSAVAIAEYLGGNIDAFALLMNEEAKKIGAFNTSFKNPHGLDAEGHYTTAYDLAQISREAMKNDTFRKIVSTKTYTIPYYGEEWDRALKNHNRLLWTYDGCNGIKTGFTKKSGRCLVSAAERGGKSLICVTLSAPNDWSDHQTLLDYGFTNFSLQKVCVKGEKATSFTYDEKNGRKVNLLFQEDLSVLFKDGEKVTTKMVLNDIKTPVKKGAIAGVYEIYVDNELITKTNLVTEKNIEKLGFFERLIIKIRRLFHLIFR